ADLFGSLRQAQLALHILGIELGDALPAKQGVLGTSGFSKEVRGLAVLLDGLLATVLPLLQESVAGDAFRGLLYVAGAQKAVVERQRLSLVARIGEHVEQIAVVHRGPLRLLGSCVQVAERLRGFLVLRRVVKRREIRLDGVLQAILLHEA